MEAITNHKANREELNRLIKDYEETMEEFNDEVSNVLKSQSGTQLSTSQTLNLNDINTVTPLEVASDIQAIKTFWNGMVEADNTAESQFSNAEGSVQELEGTIVNFLEAIGKNGGKVDSLNVDKLRSAVFEDQAMLNAIEGKLGEGEKLSSAERDLLYQYLQNEFFDEADHERMEKVTDLMDDGEKMKKYMNENILTTEERLEGEIMFLELYLFPGNERPNDLRDGESNDRIKLENYLEVLKNAHTDIQATAEMYGWDRDSKDLLYAHVDNIETNFSHNPVSGHTESEITIMGHPGDLEDIYTREEVAELDEPPFGLHDAQRSISDIEFFWGSDAIKNLKQREILDIKKDINTYTKDFFTEELFGLALGLLPGKEALDALMTSGEYAQGKRENEQELSYAEMEQVAMELSLELQVNSSRSGANVEVKLLPSDKTFKIIDRWSAVYQVDNTVPYPETEIDEQDWVGLNDFIYGEDDDKDGGAKAEMKYDKDNNIEGDVYDFIMEGDVDSDDPTVEKAAKVIDK